MFQWFCRVPITNPQYFATESPSNTRMKTFHLQLLQNLLDISLQNFANG